MRNMRREKRESNILFILLGILALLLSTALALAQKPSTNKPTLIIQPFGLLKGL